LVWASDAWWREETVHDRDLPFTEAAHRVLALAGVEANRLRHEYVGTEHLVLALVRQTHGILGTALRTLRVDGEQVRAMIEATVRPGTGTAVHDHALPYTSRTRRVFELAKDSAQILGEREIGAEHLLVGVLREAKGVGGQILLYHGLSEAAALDEIKRIHRGEDTPAT
jgi:ATP-dependent Clp protease ATP-binding subunit ClpC